MAGAILGVDLGGTRVRAGKVRAGAIEARVSRAISRHESAELVLGEVFEAIDQVFDRDVAGIGFCVPSIVDVDRGIVYSVENIRSWTEVPLKDELERRYGVPARVNNDANAFAVGELHFGKGRAYRNLVGIVIGTGMGAGIVVEGRLYNGANCGAGEIGSIPYGDSTLERKCSGDWLRAASGIDGEILHQRALAGDPFARDLFASLGTALGDAILIVLYAYDPEIIVLGGSVSQAFALFEESMRRRLEAFAFPRTLERLVIAPSETKEIALLGAAAIYLDAAARRSEAFEPLSS